LKCIRAIFQVNINIIPILGELLSTSSWADNFWLARNSVRLTTFVIKSNWALETIEFYLGQGLAFVNAQTLELEGRVAAVGARISLFIL